MAFAACLPRTSAGHLPGPAAGASRRGRRCPRPVRAMCGHSQRALPQPLGAACGRSPRRPHVGRRHLEARPPRDPRDAGPWEAWLAVQRLGDRLVLLHHGTRARGPAPARGTEAGDVRAVENRPESAPSADRRAVPDVSRVFLTATPRPLASCEQVPKDPPLVRSGSNDSRPGRASILRCFGAGSAAGPTLSHALAGTRAAAPEVKRGS